MGNQRFSLAASLSVAWYCLRGERKPLGPGYLMGTVCWNYRPLWHTPSWKIRPRKSGYAIFPPKDGQKLPKEHDYRLSVYSEKTILSILSILLSGAELAEYYSVHSWISNYRQFCVFSFRIVPKERALSHLFTLSQAFEACFQERTRPKSPIHSLTSFWGLFPRKNAP